MKHAVKIISLLALGMSSIMQAKIILCDLGGTFVDVSKSSYALQELGLHNILMHGLTNSFKFNPQAKMFATLEKIGGVQTAISHETTAAVPKIYCDWMAGMHENPVEIRNYILQEIDKLYTENFFATYFEYKVVRNAIEAMFDPEKLVKHQYAIEPMMRLLERIDLNEHTIVIVSNWDQHSYPLFLESEVGKRLCKYVKKEDMIVSGFIKHNKPHPEFYQEIFKRYGTPDATEYLFIDNEPVNIKAAQQHNIPSIQYTGDHSAIQQELLCQGIIKSA